MVNLPGIEIVVTLIDCLGEFFDSGSVILLINGDQFLS